MEKWKPQRNWALEKNATGKTAGRADTTAAWLNLV